MSDFQRRYLHAPIEPTPNFHFIRFLEQQFHRLFDHRFGFLNGLPLAGHAQFRTSGHKPFVLALNHGR